MSHLFAFSYCSWGSQGKNTEVVCHSLLQRTTFCQNAPPRPIHLGWSYTAWLKPFRDDLNKIPYDYTVEVTNRFKGLDLIDTVPDELWIDRGSWHCTRGSDQDHPQETEMQKSKMAVWGGFTNNCEKKWEGKNKWEKERYTHLNAEFQRIARRDKKVFLSDQCKEIEENNRMGKTRDLFKKIRDTNGTFHAKMGWIKDRNGMDLTEAEDIKKRWQEHTEELYKKRSSRPR